jgi:hypothetical protein
MSVEFTWTYNNETIEEPFADTAGTTYTHKLKNIGTNSAQNIGFYLQVASLEGDIDRPSTDGVLADWYDALTKGAIGGSPGPGFSITQGGATTYFTHDVGSSADNPIPLSVGSGDGATLEPGEEVELQFAYNPDVGDPTRRLYVQIALAYVEV